jgi:hypothetical protein
MYGDQAKKDIFTMDHRKTPFFTFQGSIQGSTENCEKNDRQADGLLISDHCRAALDATPFMYHSRDLSHSQSLSQ